MQHLEGAGVPGDARVEIVEEALINFGSQIVNTLLPVLFVRELGLSAGVLGLYWAAGGTGVLLGARSAGPSDTAAPSASPASAWRPPRWPCRSSTGACGCGSPGPAG
ncbi:hypothetical protein ACWGI0_29685 [Streptomyces sp. NPDC054802]